MPNQQMSLCRARGPLNMPLVWPHFSHGLKGCHAKGYHLILIVFFSIATISFTIHAFIQIVLAIAKGLIYFTNNGKYQL